MHETPTRTQLPATPGQTVGPFFGYALPYEGGGQLVLVSSDLAADGASGPTLADVYADEGHAGVERSVGTLFGFGFLETLEIDTVSFGRLLELAEPIAFNLLDDLISTGLARPDYFDWPAQWANQMVELDPEVVVLFIGANDHQDMVDAAGQRLIEGSESWRDEWRARMIAALDILTTDDRIVYWVTQPPMRDGALDAGVRVINEVADEVLADRSEVLAIDIWELFGGDGAYQDRLTGPDGDTITARISDGVHLSRPAASWVADLVFAELDARFVFSP